MDTRVNTIILRGFLHSRPEFSHENHGREFYRFSLLVPRLSGAEDILPVIAARDVLEHTELDGGILEITGQIRSFNNRSDTGRRLVISVYAEKIALCDAEPENLVSLIGTICKEPVYRRTPLGREICDVMLAVNRSYHRSDYLPIILWGRSAKEATQFTVGTMLQVEGRLQSREYQKQLPDGVEKRTAYEISAMSTLVYSPREAEEVPAF